MSYVKAIIKEWDETSRLAKVRQSCKRKAVGCCVMWISEEGKKVVVVCRTTNGPSAAGVCTNVVGGCGCVHAEPKAVLNTLHALPKHYRQRRLLMLCDYSPCTNCANLIVESTLFGVVLYRTLTEHDKRGVEILIAGGILCESQASFERIGTPKATESVFELDAAIKGL